jgi:cytidylate kinase
MLDEVTTAIATGAAGNIIAYMLNDRLDALRAQFARIFRHGTEKEKSAALQALEQDASALLNGKASEASLAKQWINFLLSYLAAHPRVREDLEAFNSSAGVNKTMIIESQHNHGSGVFIGGDNYGSMTFESPR